MTITIRVPGVPVPQGSMQHFGKGRVKYRDDLKPWRNAVRTAYAQNYGFRTFTGPIALDLEFIMPRPASHYGTGANAGRIKESYEAAQCTVRPDLDKLTRAVADALTLDKGDLGALPRPFTDDSAITEIHARKRYITRGEKPGVIVGINLAYG